MPEPFYALIISLGEAQALDRVLRERADYPEGLPYTYETLADIAGGEEVDDTPVLTVAQALELGDHIAQTYGSESCST